MSLVRRPVLRFFGGKNKLAPWIVSNLPEHQKYAEPFGGSASVLMHKPMSQIEIYNDIDKEVTNVFVVMQNRELFETLLWRLKFTPYSSEEYFRSRETSDDPVERAARTIIKSFFGHGSDSIFRNSGVRKYSHNRAGRVNDTISAAEWATYVHEALITFANRLAPGNEGALRTMILCEPALDVIRRHDGPKTLFYLDPPYLRCTRTGNGRYRHEMSDDDHQILLETLLRLRSMVVLSGYPSIMYDEMLVGWEHIERDFRGRTEVLWRNPAAVAAMPAQIAIPYPDDDDDEDAA
jgi:DNA adenine methylase